jgi:hypothetical protein
MWVREKTLPSLLLRSSRFKYIRDLWTRQDPKVPSTLRQMAALSRCPKPDSISGIMRLLGSVFVVVLLIIGILVLAHYRHRHRRMWPCSVPRLFTPPLSFVFVAFWCKNERLGFEVRNVGQLSVSQVRIFFIWVEYL